MKNDPSGRNRKPMSKTIKMTVNPVSPSKKQLHHRLIAKPEIVHRG